MAVYPVWLPMERAAKMTPWSEGLQAPELRHPAFSEPQFHLCKVKTVRARLTLGRGTCCEIAHSKCRTLDIQKVSLSFREKPSLVGKEASRHTELWDMKWGQKSRRIAVCVAG